MSDETPIPADEPVETAQDAATEPATAPPWGDDFDAERAWKTIQNLRQFEKQAKEYERIQSDEDARAEWLKSHGYEIEDEPGTPDEDDLFEEDDPVAPLRKDIDEFRQWKQQQEAKENAAAIRRDLDQFSEGSDWDLDDDDREEIVSRASRQNPKGFGPEELKQAYDWFIGRLDRAAEAAVERAKKPKPKAPHVTAAGKAATGTKSITDMTPAEHREWARRRYQELSTGD